MLEKDKLLYYIVTLTHLFSSARVVPNKGRTCQSYDGLYIWDKEGVSVAGVPGEGAADWSKMAEPASQ